MKSERYLSFFTVFVLLIQSICGMQQDPKKSTPSFCFYKENQECKLPDTLLPLENQNRTLSTSEKGELLTKSKKPFSYRLYQAASDKKSESVVIIALGENFCHRDPLPFACYEPFIREFLKLGYDVATFRYTWGKKVPPCLSWYLKSNNHEELMALVDYLKQSSYEKRFFYGDCYGTYNGLKAQIASNNTAFTKMILNAVFPSYREAANTGAESVSAKCWDVIRTPFLCSTRLFLYLIFGEYSVTELIRDITVPILFIWGDADHLVNERNRQEVYCSATCSKSYLVTPYGHSDSFAYREEEKGLGRRIVLSVMHEFYSQSKFS